MNLEAWRRPLHALTLALGILGAVCLVTSRDRSSGTFDESHHLATGLEWWQFGTYTWWTENPPLARVAVAALPYLDGLRLPPRDEWDPRTKPLFLSWWVGLDVLYGGRGYAANLHRARLGVFPFYVLLVVATWGLAAGWRRPWAGLVAVGLVATLPSSLAHGGLATTDVPFTATFLLAVLAFCGWLETPSIPRALLAGTAFAAGLLTKFSMLVFFPLVVLALVVARRLAGHPLRPARDGVPLRWRSVAGALALGCLAAALVTWGGYRFSVGSLGEVLERTGWRDVTPAAGHQRALRRLVLGTRLPAPELLHGLLFLARHNAAGGKAYLFGHISRFGFRSYYPVALAVKTPLPFLLAALAAVTVLLRRARRPLLADSWRATGAALGALIIVAVAMTSHINLGSRHVLPVLPLLGVAAAGAFAAQLETTTGSRRRVLVAFGALVLAAQASIAVATRPHYLGYFSALAGRDPARMLTDSDLDWGQDFFELERQARDRSIDTLKIAYFGVINRCAHGLPRLEPLVPGQPTTGWIAISETYYREHTMLALVRDPCDGRSWYRPEEIPAHPYAWLRAYEPVAIVGTSIRLYHLPPSTS